MYDSKGFFYIYISVVPINITLHVNKLHTLKPNNSFVHVKEWMCSGC